MPYLELAGKKIGSFHQGNRSDLSPVYLPTLLCINCLKTLKKNLKVAPPRKRRKILQNVTLVHYKNASKKFSRILCTIPLNSIPFEWVERIGKKGQQRNNEDTRELTFTS